MHTNGLCMGSLFTDNENKMSKDLEVLKADVKKLILKDWTATEVTKFDEFMEDVIIATMQVNKLPIHVVVGRSEQLVCCGKPYHERDLEHGMCHQCWEPTKEAN